MQNLSQPMGNALIVCDDIIEDKRTGKKTLVGMFSKIHANKLPAVHPRMNIFISFDNAKGKYSSVIKIIHEASGKVIAETKGEINVKSPMDVTDLNLCFMNINFPAEGVYNIEFHCDDDLVLQRRFTVQILKPEPGKQR